MKIDSRQAVLATVVALALASAAGCSGTVRRAAVPAEPAVEATRPEPRRTTPSPTEAGATAPGSASRSAPTAYHRIAPGETLSAIARAYGVRVEELVRANGIADPNRIEAGSRLIIPRPEVGGDPGSIAAGTEWIWPLRQGEMLAPFGERRRTHRHGGLDIRGRSGQEVVAARDGRVVYSGAGMRGYGKTVVLDHGDGFRSLYAHNSALLVNEGERVRQGQTIARVGRSGNATTDHCHFEIRRNRVAVDPLPYLTVPVARAEATR